MSESREVNADIAAAFSDEAVHEIPLVRESPAASLYLDDSEKIAQLLSEGSVEIGPMPDLSDPVQEALTIDTPDHRKFVVSVVGSKESENNDGTYLNIELEAEVDPEYLKELEEREDY